MPADRLPSALRPMLKPYLPASYPQARAASREPLRPCGCAGSAPADALEDDLVAVAVHEYGRPVCLRLGGQQARGVALDGPCGRCRVAGQADCRRSGGHRHSCSRGRRGGGGRGRQAGQRRRGGGSRRRFGRSRRGCGSSGCGSWHGSRRGCRSGSRSGCRRGGRCGSRPGLCMAPWATTPSASGGMQPQSVSSRVLRRFAGAHLSSRGGPAARRLVLASASPPAGLVSPSVSPSLQFSLLLFCAFRTLFLAFRLQPARVAAARRPPQ